MAIRVLHGMTLHSDNLSPAIQKVLADFARPRRRLLTVARTNAQIAANMVEIRAYSSHKKALKSASHFAKREARMDDLLNLLPAETREQILASIDRRDIQQIVSKFSDVLWTDNEESTLFKLFYECHALELLEPALLSIGRDPFGDLLREDGDNDSCSTPLQDARKELRIFQKLLRDRRKPTRSDEYAERRKDYASGSGGLSNGW